MPTSIIKPYSEISAGFFMEKQRPKTHLAYITQNIGIVVVTVQRSWLLDQTRGTESLLIL